MFCAVGPSRSSQGIRRFSIASASGPRRQTSLIHPLVVMTLLLLVTSPTMMNQKKACFSWVEGYVTRSLSSRSTRATIMSSVGRPNTPFNDRRLIIGGIPLQFSWNKRPTGTVPSHIGSSSNTYRRHATMSRFVTQEDADIITDTSGDIVDDGDDEDDDEIISEDHALHHVVVRRTRQSISFRNGSPLVFSGAVAFTYSNTAASSSSSSIKGIPMGALVTISVQEKNDESNGNNSHKRGGGKPNKRGGKYNNRRGGGGKQKEEEIKYPHYNLNEEEEENEENDSEKSDPPSFPSQIIGYGVYNPISMYRVRILCHASSHASLVSQLQRDLSASGDNEADCFTTEQAMATIVRHKLQTAIPIRTQVLGLPSSETDSFRLINGEGDGLSGLAVDILGGRVAVVMSSAAWCEIHKDTIYRELQHALDTHFPPNSIDIIWRTTASRLDQDGYPKQAQTPNDTEGAKKEEVVIVMESGVKYNTFPYSNSQKTGFYCDQRVNRQTVAKLCEGRRVLDLCCYNGGFALNAMVHGGAVSCVGVDSSQDAIDAAQDNAALNNVDSSQIEFVKADIHYFMQKALDEGKEFDVIVLDPPKLAPTASGLERAARKYGALNRLALKLISPTKGGVLMTCTCSGAMTQKDGGQYFLQTVSNASTRHVTLLETSGAAPCHTTSPASYPAGAYLTAALFHVGPIL